MTRAYQSINAAKAAANRLRTDRADRGEPISHAQSLERIAKTSGFRDWNTMAAAIGQNGWNAGDRVTGRYLSHAFAGRIVTATTPENGWQSVEIALDHPIDVVTSEKFSNNRSRLFGAVGPKGHSNERTSDGLPQLIIDL